VVQTWSDTQIVALVASGSASGNALVLQNGVMSNPVPFAVNTLQLTTISPNSGAAGTSVTFTGAGFGSSQGAGVAWLGSTAGTVVSWSDTQVVATVASNALTGIARIQQNGAWSNALAFTVPAANGVTLMPSMINMMVGDTHAIQALSAAGQPVTGLTWTSSDPTVVSLSTDDPPILTALAAGHVTITAGTASADVTVSSPTDFPAGPPLGTVLWSHPGDVWSILPAVPSPSGVADVFAVMNDDTVQAITSDGTTAWTADLNAATVLPDFQGGLVTLNWEGSSLVKLDGATGQALSLYTSGDPNVHLLSQEVAVFTDGTVIAVQIDETNNSQIAALGFDSATGGQKFSVPVPGTGLPGAAYGGAGEVLIAGDGYAYVPYYNFRLEPDGGGATSHLGMLRISSSGAYTDLTVDDFATADPQFWEAPGLNAGWVFTNADTGVLFAWEGLFGGPRMSIINDTGVSQVAAPQIDPDFTVSPVLQAQDGSFIGFSGPGWNMVSFDASGAVRWSVPGYYPLMALADGGVIATTDYVSATIFDKNGGAMGQIANMPTYSWRGNLYQLGSVDRMAYPPVPSPTIDMALTLCAWLGCNPSGNGTAARPWYFKLIWQNDCSTVPWPCGFALYPDDPQATPGLAVGASSQAGVIKSAALSAFKKAFDPYPVSVSEGTPNDGDNRAVVVDGIKSNNDGESCGLSAPAPGGHESNVYYLPHMEQAQWALNLVIGTFQAVQQAVGNTALMEAIGTGIGTTAAHETAHQFLGDGWGMDDKSKNTYNGQGCRGDLSPWVYGFGPIQWEDVTATALKNKLGAGWHR